MSSSLPATAPVAVGEQLDAYHSQVITDGSPDFRYSEPLTNVQKVAAICSILNYKIEDFDLSADFPLRAWSNSNDMGLLRCGIYIADMRQKFFGLIVGSKPETARHDAWELEAESKFWMEEFDSIIFRRQTGERRAPRRVYH